MHCPASTNDTPNIRHDVYLVQDLLH